jgi:mRNA deadenylase 3'-5' endonuclease subunit Ccr4
MIKLKYLFVLMMTLAFFIGTAQSLKIMTYNIRLNLDSDGENSWTNRKDFFESQMQFYEPDIFGVQEVTPIQVRDIFNGTS